MKKLSIALLALATALAIAPAALADTFYFTYSSPKADASGTLNVTDNGNGTYTVTSGTIGLTYYNSPTYTGTITSPPTCCGADNLLYPSSTALTKNGFGLLLDLGGLEFTTTDGLVNLWGGDNNGYGTSTDSYSITQNNLDWVDYPGTFTLSTTPEPSSLLLLGTGLLGLAFLTFRTAKNAKLGGIPKVSLPA